MAPDGVEWHVGRRWLTRRPKLNRPRRGDAASESFFNSGQGWLDFSNFELGEELLLVTVAIALVLVLVPVLFFGVELIIVGALLAGGVLAHTVLRQPWVIEARSRDPFGAGRHLDWRVRGWRESRKLIAQVASDLSAGREPSGLNSSTYSSG